ncbi:hypothetical protein Tco_0915912, partial [Tanacetum coccineum]
GKHRGHIVGRGRKLFNMGKSKVFGSQLQDGLGSESGGRSGEVRIGEGGSGKGGSDNGDDKGK